MKLIGVSAIGTSAAIFCLAAVVTPSAKAQVAATNRPMWQTAKLKLADLPVKGRAPKTGYDRSNFGPTWTDANSADPGGTSHNGCDTRNDILRRDLTSIVLKSVSGCGNGLGVARGTLFDPYTGKTMQFVRGTGTSTLVQIDHVVSLSNAWQTGAQQKSAAARVDFANDPLNLIAVEGRVNQAKSDGDAATWLPPNKAFRCTFAYRQVMVKSKYRLWVTKPEGEALNRILTSCINTGHA